MPEIYFFLSKNTLLWKFGKNEKKKTIVFVTKLEMGREEKIIDDCLINL